MEEDGFHSYHFKNFLKAYSPQGARACSCEREHRVATRSIYLGEGVLKRSGEILTAKFGASPAVWVLSDENTEKAAGSELKRRLKGARLHSTVLPALPEPKTTYALAGALRRQAEEVSPDLLLSVGGGTISDLGKMVSLDTGLPNWCLSTSPSVDAYVSGTSAVKEKGLHIAIPTAASEAVLSDLEVLSKAPRELFLSGLGDLAVKLIAYLEWHLSAWATGEHICPEIAALSLSSVRSAVQAAARAKEENQGAMGSLTDAQHTSALCMQAYGSSRSAAAAEHTPAHFGRSAER